MLGIAQKLFAERTLKSLRESTKGQQRWPFLEKMLIAKSLGYVDFSLANHLLKSNEKECVAALICHLSQASRQGHICVKIADEKITPSPEEIWAVEDLDELHGSISSFDFSFNHLTSLILKGTKSIASPLIYDVSTKQGAINAPIYKNGCFYYLQRCWHLETLFLTSLLQHLKHPLSFPIDLVKAASQTQTLIDKGILLPEQAEAIVKASRSPLTLITGGPGTGKTYTAGLLLRIIWELLSPKDQANFNIVLAAPTGKAAANLESSIQRSLGHIENFPAVKAQTLHQLLEVKKHGGTKKFVELTADLILIDESSMIDIHLMGQLLSALKPGARLVFLGDMHQLPSVEAGALFADLSLYFLSNGERKNQVVELKKCLRSELKGIIDLASHIKTGDADSALKLLNHVEGISLIELEEQFNQDTAVQDDKMMQDSDCVGPSSSTAVYRFNAKELQKRLLKHVLPHFPVISRLPDDPIQLLKQFSHFRLLTPMRQGVLGVDALNAAIFEAMSVKMSSNGCLIVPIMVMQNDYQRELFNGEVGLLVKDRESEFALFASRESRHKIRKIPALLMPRFEYAYCLSVHKSQGSEFDHVVLLLPDGAQSFGREALYTGVTRAKNRLEIWSRPAVLTQMINRLDFRQSGVANRLST